MLISETLIDHGDKYQTCLDIGSYYHLNVILTYQNQNVLISQ